MSEKVVDDLRKTVVPGSRLSIAAASFSLYAFETLKDELWKIDSLRFIFTSRTFVKKHLIPYRKLRNGSILIVIAL